MSKIFIINEKNRLDDISIIRLFCVIVVVFFHCYGMMFAGAHFPATISIYESIYFILNQCVFINIAMPLFVVVSGYLFEFLLDRGKYPTWGNLLHKKGVRIILPYFVFGIFFMATTNDWHPLQLFRSYWHLWFLPMLFWCFILGYFISRLKLNVYIESLLLLISFCGTFSPKFIPMWFGLHNLSRWFYWFYLGMALYKYRNWIFSHLHRYRLYLLLFLCYILVTILYPVEYGSDTWYSVLSTTCCIISITYLMKMVDWNKYRITSAAIKLSSYSFGIYIWHNWVALMLISNTCKRLFGLENLAANHVVLFPLCFSIITLLISWILSWLLMKSKLGKYLIG